jgi:hypothetical protein
MEYPGAGEAKITKTYAVNRKDKSRIKFGHFGLRIHVNYSEWLLSYTQQKKIGCKRGEFILKINFLFKKPHQDDNFILFYANTQLIITNVVVHFE